MSLTGSSCQWVAYCYRQHICHLQFRQDHVSSQLRLPTHFVAGGSGGFLVHMLVFERAKLWQEVWHWEDDRPGPGGPRYRGPGLISWCWLCSEQWGEAWGGRVCWNSYLSVCITEILSRLITRSGTTWRIGTAWSSTRGGRSSCWLRSRSRCARQPSRPVRERAPGCVLDCFI